MPSKKKKLSKTTKKVKATLEHSALNDELREFNLLCSSLSTREHAEQVRLLLQWFFRPASIVVVLIAIVGIGWLMTFA